MCSKIERAAIGLDLDDAAGRDSVGGPMDEDFADAFVRDQQNRSRVEIARQLARLTHRAFRFGELLLRAVAPGQ
jgi:hypothetical protein